MPDSRSQSVPTAPRESGIARARRGRALRRVGIVLLTTYVALGATGWLGVRSASVSDTGGGYELTVRYAKVTRPALATPWGFTVTREGGFDARPITVATTVGWLGLFDENGRNPAPSSEVAEADMLVWEFDPPDGDTFTFDFDARIGPNVQSGMTVTTELREDDVVVASVTYTMRVMP